MTAASRLQPAFVLHRRDYRNTSLLVDLYSRDQGRLRLIAKGARRRRGSGPLLQPFSPLLVSWTGRSDLATLTDVERAVAPPALRGAGLLCGFYLNELLERLLAPGDADAELFMDYARTLDALADLEQDRRSAGDGARALLLRRFELRLLAAVGYGLALQHSAAGDPIVADRRYRYRVGQGAPIEDRRGRAASPADGIPVVGSTLLGLAAGRLDQAGQREARDLLRAVLAPHLGDRPLRSRQLYADYLRLRPGTR